MNRLTTWYRHLFSTKGQRGLAGALVVLSVLPFVVLAFDSHPSLDDFSDAVMRQRLGFWGAQRDLYLGWTGRYATSLLLMDVSPLRWPGWPGVYFLVPLGTLLALAGGLFALFTALAEGAWAVRTRLLATGAVLALWLAQAPSVAECLYWYNGVAVYSLPNALFLLWLVALLGLVRSARPAFGYWYRGLATAGLSIFLIGSNEIVALVVLAGLAGTGLWAWWRRREHLPALLGLLLLAAVAAPVAFLAPGNMQRLAVINRPVQLGWAAVGAVASSVYLVVNWLGEWLVLAATLLALPALARLAERPGTLAHRLSRVQPLLLAGGLLALLVLAGAPSYWATGGMMPLRARTAVYLLFLVGWLVLVLAGLGAARRRWPRLGAGRLAWPRPMAAALWAGLLLSFVTDHNVRVAHASVGAGSNNIVLAYRDWLTGAARRYDAQLRGRYQQLRATPGRSVRLPPLVAEPPTLLYYDITTDSTYWGNTAYAQYFGQRAVWIGPGGHAPIP